MSFATLGPITFEVSADRVRTWSDLKRTRPARWSTHDVYSRKPVKEFQGPGLETISLSILFDINRGVVPKDEIKRIKDSEETGEVLDFIAGGEPIGDYVIMNVSEDWRRVSAKGELQAVQVDLTLEEYE